MDEFICLKNFLKLSIIVPTFNDEKIITKCLTSLLHQNFDSNTYEILIINDGSNDNTVLLIKEFLNQYSFIRLINKTKGGIPSAINLGIKHARGKYITFINPNTIVTNNLFINIINLIESHNLDAFFFSVADNLEKIDAIDDKYITINKNDCYQYLKEKCVYKTSIIKQNNLLFNELIRDDIDVLFNYKYIQHCQNIIAGTKSKLGFIKNNNIIDKKIKAIELYNSYLLSCNEIKCYKLNDNSSNDLYNLCLTKYITQYLWCVIIHKLNVKKAILDLKKYDISLKDIRIKLSGNNKFKSWLEYKFRNELMFKIIYFIYKVFGKNK